MISQNITLQIIEQSIRKTCVIDDSAEKMLTLVKYMGTKNKGVGRSLFIFIAMQYGFEPEEICDYLRIHREEFNRKWADLDTLYAAGKQKFEKFDKKKVQVEHDETPFFFYRKLRLIYNYLRYTYKKTPL